jgi:hypothetical protein
MKNSFAVRQFVALARGEITPHKPVVADRIKSVSVEEALCLACNVLGTSDVISFEDGTIWHVCQTCSNVLINGQDCKRMLLPNGRMYRRNEK